MKDRRALSDDFTVVGDFYFRSRYGMTDGVKLDISISMNNRNAGDFSLPINLFKVYAQGMKESEVVRSHGGAACVSTTHPGKSKMIF